MKALDTNILVRWITRDDPHQAAIADQVLQQPVFISWTVFLELAWVLGGRSYRMDRATLAGVLTTLLNVTTVTVPAEQEVRWAIDRFAQGADIADMLHLVASRGGESFVSFERRLAERAGADSPLPIETLA